jgi:hypothetical protein
MSKLFDCADLADMTIETNDGKERKCHTFAIAASSYVFKTMLTCGMKESTTRRISFPEAKPEIVDLYLQLAYGKNVSIDLDSLDDLLDFGKLYDIGPIRDSLVTWVDSIETKVTHLDQIVFYLSKRDSLAEFLQRPVYDDDDDLTSFCRFNLHTLCFSNWVLSLSIDEFKSFLDAEEWLAVPGSTIDPWMWYRFNLICRFIDHCSTEDVDDGAIKLLFKLVDFKCMTAPQLTDVIRRPLIRNHPTLLWTAMDCFIARNSIYTINGSLVKHL